jgi:hypothetical protein
MPFKSKAQRRKFAELLVKGEITPEAYERWNRETGRAELPERVKPKRKRKAARKARRRSTASTKSKGRSKTKAKSRAARRSR